MKITTTHDDGTTTDITVGVQVAYDIAYHSLDWGSGFLDLEEMDAIARMGEACRFPSFEDALEFVRSTRERQDREQKLKEQRRQRKATTEWLQS